MGLLDVWSSMVCRSYLSFEKTEWMVIKFAVYFLGMVVVSGGQNQVALRTNCPC